MVEHGPQCVCTLCIIAARPRTSLVNSTSPLTDRGAALSRLEATMLASTILLGVAHGSGATLDDARQVVREVARLSDAERATLLASVKRGAE